MARAAFLLLSGKHTSNGQDGAARAVLGDEAGSVAGRCEDNDRRGGCLEGRLDRGHGDNLCLQLQKCYEIVETKWHRL
jgi:hypothetical protein